MNFPVDIIHHILSYNDSVKLRNGKYMNQIPKNDKRYEMLLNIQRTIHKVTETLYSIYVSKKLQIYINIYNFYPEYTYHTKYHSVCTIYMK